MSGARPDTPEERILLAGEYVLGVLDAEEQRDVARAAAGDKLLADEIAGWEHRLAPMLTAAPDLPPPDGLWARIAEAKARAALSQSALSASAATPIELSAAPRRAGKLPVELRAELTGQPPARPPAEPVWLRPAAAGRAAPGRGASKSAWPWRASAIGSLALAAGLAGFALLPSLAPREAAPALGGRTVALAAVLTPPDPAAEPRPAVTPQLATDTGIGKLRLSEPQDPPEPSRASRMSGFLATTWPDGAVLLTAFGPAAAPAGKELELWLQPPGDAAPRSLGVAPASGETLLLPAMPPAGATLSVSVEPAGGSTTGAPSGKVVYSGTLQPVQR